MKIGISSKIKSSSLFCMGDFPEKSDNIYLKYQQFLHLLKVFFIRILLTYIPGILNKAVS
jgi:hypothetical protein